MCLALAGCNVGVVQQGPGGGSGGADAGQQPEPDAEASSADAAPPDYALIVPQTPVELSLGQRAELSLQLSSERFAGPVSLSADGFPESWTVTFEPSNVVTLIADRTTTVIVRIEVPSDGEAGTATLNVTADAAPGIRTGSAAVDVANELTIVIGAGTGDGNHAFPENLQVRIGTTVTFLNADGSAHRIHSGNEAAGFVHQDDDMNQGQSYSFSFTAPGAFGYYCHIHEQEAGIGSFVSLAP